MGELREATLSRFSSRLFTRIVGEANERELFEVGELS